nr:MAG TPA: glutaredoxin-like protein [Caudoviricetes sp.]
MGKVKVYSTHCPKCSVVEKKLQMKGIEFDTCDDVNIMKEKNMLAAPYLEVDGELLDFAKAIAWITKQ